MVAAALSTAFSMYGAPVLHGCHGQVRTLLTRPSGPSRLNSSQKNESAAPGLCRRSVRSRKLSLTNSSGQRGRCTSTSTTPSLQSTRLRTNVAGSL